MTDPNPAPGRALKRPPLSLLQLVLLVGVLAALLVVLDFNQRLAAAQRSRDAADQAATEVAALEYENAILKTQVAYATTDAAVIAWAHEQGKAVQAGEVLVIPVVPTAPPTPPTVVVTTVAVAPPWQLWWNLFFDAAPVAGR